MFHCVSKDSDLDGWVLVPDDDDVQQLETLLVDQSFSIETNTSLEGHPPSSTIHKSDTFDSQTELTELERDGDDMIVDDSPKHNRYSSPLFQQMLGKPIEPIKISKQTIPDDGSINNLLRTTSLVSKSQKIPEILAHVEDREQLTPINNTKNNSKEEILDDNLLKELSVPDKRPSIQDPEQVLMKNVVPGKSFLKG